MPLQIRRGTDDERTSVVFANGEIVYTTDTQQLYVGDGSTPGGNVVSGGTSGATALSELSDVFLPITPTDGQALVWDNANSYWRSGTITSGGLNEIVEDLTPQLGGGLDLNGQSIYGNGNITITGNINASSVFGDIVGLDSTLLVDSVNSNIPGEVISGTITASFIGNLSSDYIQSSSSTIQIVADQISIRPSNGNLNVGYSPDNIDGNISIFKNSYTGFASKGISLYTGHENVSVDGLKFARSRGTPSSPTATILGDSLGGFDFFGHDGVTYRNSLNISSIVTESPVEGNVESQLRFSFLNNFASDTKFRFNSDGRLQIGCADTSEVGNGAVEIFTQTNGGTSVTAQPLRIAQFFDGADASNIVFQRSRGTRAVPAAVVSGDEMIEIIGYGFDGTGNRQSSRIRFVVDGTVSSNVVPGQISFDVANTSGSISQVASIGSNGLFSSKYGLNVEALSAPPSSPVINTIYVADGATWDPASKSGAVAYPVFYDGSSYNALY